MVKTAAARDWRPSATDANGVAVGAKIDVNTELTHDQDNAEVVGLTGGRFVVIWESFLQDGDGNGIYAQRYASDGTPDGVEFKVNATTLDSQSEPAVTALEDGGFVVSWQSGLTNPDIMAQRFDTNGNAVGGEFQVKVDGIGAQQRPAITSLPNGGLAVVWESDRQDGNGQQVYARTYDLGTSDPVVLTGGSESQVNEVTAGSQNTSSVAALPDGGYIVVWSSDNIDGSSSAVVGQRYDAHGRAVGGQFQVNTYTAASADGSQKSTFSTTAASLSPGAPTVSIATATTAFTRAASARMGKPISGEVLDLKHRQLAQSERVPRWRPSDNGQYVVTWIGTTRRVRPKDAGVSSLSA